MSEKMISVVTGMARDAKTSEEAARYHEWAEKAKDRLYAPLSGRTLVVDSWPSHEGAILEREESTYTDSEWPGCKYRAGRSGVNIEITGKRPVYFRGKWSVRVKVEFVGDGEPSTFAGGRVLCWDWIDAKMVLEGDI